MVRGILWGIGAVLLILAAIVGVRTATYGAPAPAASVSAPDLAAYEIDMDAASARLSQAIRFQTISLTGAATDDPAQFVQFRAWLVETFPALHAAATLERVNEHSLLYRIEGADPNAAPIILAAHQDVVPVPPDARWDAEPFGGEIRDGAIWGRGAMDDKGSLIAILEAAEMLARAGRKPARTLYFAFGHDEETTGVNGAGAMVKLLQERGVQAWFALDEGMAGLENHPLTGKPATMIGVSEKGYGTLRVHAEAEAGHSSTPPRDTAVSRLARAVTAIHQMPITRAIEGGPADGMMRALAPDLDVTTRMAIANEWLFGPLLQAQLKDNVAGMALIGTTVAPTMISGGVRENVLPSSAEAMINLRIHPRDTPDSLLAGARAAIEGMEGVSVDWAADAIPSSPVSSTSASSYALIASLAQTGAPDARVAPTLVLGATDGRYYPSVAQNVYRFYPMRLSDEEIRLPHGDNERLSIANFERMIRFYAALMDAPASDMGGSETNE